MFLLKNYCIIVSSVRIVNMNSFIRLFLTLFLILSSMKSVAQDPHFSQFYANPMYLNPAYAGSNFCPRLIMNYRNQWPALPGDYVTYSTSFDFGLKEIHGGLGLIVVHDNAGWGVMTTNNISLIYSYHANISSTTTVSAGFQFSYLQRQLNANQYFGDMIDEVYGFILQSFDPFASEEYLTFVNSSFNDVFAFLISGPGITGPYASPPAFPGGAINIAVVPNTNPVLPVTISTVNDQINSQYYNHDSMTTVSAFNGYTDVFTATAIVQPCNVYHIKLAIADGTDQSYDSGVLFEAGSFDATEPGALGITAITTDIECFGDSTGELRRNGSSGSPPYFYSWAKDNVSFSSGTDDTLHANLSAGVYKVIVTDSIGCKDSVITNFNNPQQLLFHSISFDSILCNGNSTVLEIMVKGGRKQTSGKQYSYYCFLYSFDRRVC